MRMMEVRAGRTAGRALVALEGAKAGAAVRVFMLREAICKLNEQMIALSFWVAVSKDAVCEIDSGSV